MEPEVKTGKDSRSIIETLRLQGYQVIPNLNLEGVSPEEGKGVDLKGSKLRVGDILVMSVQDVGKQSILVASIQVTETNRGDNNALKLGVAIGDADGTIIVSEQGTQLQLAGKACMAPYVAAAMRMEEPPGISA